MKIILASVASVLLAACAPVGPSPESLRIDLALIEGSGWSGTLVYRDYSPPYSDVTLRVEADISKTADGLALAIRYPDEPHANSTESLALAEGGRSLGGDPVTGREEKDGSVFVTTRAACEDDNRSATCEHIYAFGPKSFSIEKRVRFDGESDYFRRNKYELSR